MEPFYRGRATTFRGARPRPGADPRPPFGPYTAPVPGHAYQDEGAGTRRRGRDVTSPT